MSEPSTTRELAPYVLTIDAGSGSCRALLFDRTGTVQATDQREWHYRFDPDHPGAMNLDPADSWEKVRSCIQGALSAAGIDPSQVGAVTATSMREGFVLYDEDGQELWACPNVDARASREAEELIEDGAADRFFTRGGDWTSITAPARFRWLARHQPDVLRRAAGMTMIADWVLFRLSGVLSTDPSNGSSSGMFDLPTRSWSTATARELDLDPAILPPVHEPGTIIGEVRDQAATETGLAAGTPVVQGGADTQLAVLGATGPGGSGFSLCGGTFWQMTAALDEPLIDPEVRLRTVCHATPGQWMIEGIGFFHGVGARFVRDLVTRSPGSTLAPDQGYAELEALAEQVGPGAGGVRYLASNTMNVRAWRHAPATLIGLDIAGDAHPPIGPIFRAVQEEAAFVAADHLAILTELTGTSPEHVDLVGGAAKGRLWPRIVADVLQRPVRVSAEPEASSLGATLGALVALGIHPDVRQAAEATIAYRQVVEPDPATADAYAAVHAHRTQLYQAVLGLADQGMVDHLWRGAGA